MPDETQSPQGSLDPAEKPAEEKKSSPALAKSEESTSSEAAKPVVDKPTAPAAAQPAAPAAAAKPPAAAGAGVAKPAAAAAPKPPAPKPVAKPDPWESPLVEKLRKTYGSGVREASTYMKQNYLVVDETVVFSVLRILRDDEKFDYCVDITAVHYPKREEQFDLVWVLYSFARNERLRVKTLLKDGEPAPTSVNLWETANWLEREVFDMFGIHFTGHPDLRRILLPEDWKGYPLRKDYGIFQQDQEWVKTNLGIESGQ